MFKPVKKTRIYEEIVTKIVKMIEKGQLVAGERLPSERDLSAIFKVSRPSVREAIKSLESRGYIESRRGEGTFVNYNPIETIVEPFAAMIFKEKHYQIQILEMRCLIEPEIARLASKRATWDDVSQIESTLKLQEKKVMKGESGADLDRLFHYKIALAAKNKLLLNVLDTAKELFTENREKYLQSPERPERSIDHHSRILSAITAGDSGAAAQAMNAHLSDINDTLFGTA